MQQIEARRYRVHTLLGEGGFGRVYRASLEGNEGFLKEVAIKLLHDEEFPDTVMQRFRDEARILGLIRDRAIVNVDPPTRLGGRWAVVMEYVDGASCGHLVSQDSPLPPSIALEIVQEVARALDVVYNQPGPDGEPLKLLHRDLKPGNLQVTNTGQVKILDFGIARAEFSNREAKTTRHIGGTIGYIAPERLEGEEGAKGDIYSLGVVLHELITGQRPSTRSGGRSNPTMSLATDGSIELSEAEVERQQGIDHVLDLARRMRDMEPDARPDARSVERECRKLLRRFEGPFLREWAEEHVPPVTGMPPDDLVGSLLVETTSAIPLPPRSDELTAYRVGRRPTLIPGEEGTERSEPTLLDQEVAPRRRKPWGLILGGLAAVALVLALVVVGVGFGVGRAMMEEDPEVEAELPPNLSERPLPAEEEAPEVAEPQPEEEPPPVVEEPEPEPEPVPVVQPRPAPVVAPTPPPAPEPALPTYPITFASKPLGLAVTIDGEPAGNTPIMELPLTEGVHTVAVGEGSRSVTVNRRAPTRYVYDQEADTWTSGM